MKPKACCSLSLGILLASAVGCAELPPEIDENEGAEPGEEDPTVVEPLVPLVVGATWTYEVDAVGFNGLIRSRVESYGEIGGAKGAERAYAVVVEQPAGFEMVYWRSYSGGRLVEHRSERRDPEWPGAASYWPHRPVLDLPEDYGPGTTWTASWTTVDEMDDGLSGPGAATFSVAGVDVDVRVTAGSFRALAVSRDGSVGYYAPGVGRVLEVDPVTGFRLELVSYEIPRP